MESHLWLGSWYYVLTAKVNITSPISGFCIGCLLHSILMHKEALDQHHVYFRSAFGSKYKTFLSFRTVYQVFTVEIVSLCGFRSEMIFWSFQLVYCTNHLQTFWNNNYNTFDNLVAQIFQTRDVTVKSSNSPLVQICRSSLVYIFFVFFFRNAPTLMMWNCALWSSSPVGIFLWTTKMWYDQYSSAFQNRVLTRSFFVC